MTTQNELETLLRQGESGKAEFKRSADNPEAIARVLAAFANTEGGVLLIGVNDDGSVDGFSDEGAEWVKAKVESIAQRVLPVPIEVGIENLQNRTIVFARVPRIPSYLGPVTSARGFTPIRKGDTVVDQETSQYSSLPSVVGAGGHARTELTLFVAMSFREELEPALVDYFAAIKRSVEKSEVPFNVVRIDLVEGDYEISQRVMDEIDKAQVVLTDLTLSPSNVYFELGYARGRGKRIIQTARKGTALEFDIRNWRTIFYRNATELEHRLVDELRIAYGEVSKSVG